MRAIFFVMKGDKGHVHCRTLEAFTSEGGFKEDWGKGWTPIVAYSIEDAVSRGFTLLRVPQPKTP